MGDDIVVSGADVAAPEIEFSEVVRRYEDKLSEEQLHSLPYLVYGVSIKRTAEIVGVKASTIRSWLSNKDFSAALADAKIAITKWHAHMLDIVAARAWERAWEIIDKDVDPDDKVGRQEQARMVRFVLDQLGLKTRKVSVEHSISGPSLNVTAETVDLIARRLYELENTIDADAIVHEVDLSKSGQMACHPETAFDVINDVGGKVQCHVCGGWYVNLPTHIEVAHGMTSDEYKGVFALDPNVTLYPQSGGEDEENS